MNNSILIVDDEAAVTLALESFFRSRGYAVSRAFYGDQAIEKIEQESPSVVILDLQMPGLDGIAVLKRIRQARLTTKTMVITGCATQYQEELDRLKPESIQFKPVSLEELMKGIEHLLGHKEASVHSAGKQEKVSVIRLLFVEAQAQIYNGYLKAHFAQSERPRYETQVATGLSEVFALLETFKPHLLLLDSSRMPIGVDPGKLAADVGEAPGKPLEVILYAFKSNSQTPAEDMQKINDTMLQVAIKHKLISNPK